MAIQPPGGLAAIAGAAEAAAHHPTLAEVLLEYQKAQQEDTEKEKQKQQVQPRSSDGHGRVVGAAPTVVANAAAGRARDSGALLDAAGSGSGSGSPDPAYFADQLQSELQQQEEAARQENEQRPRQGEAAGVAGEGGSGHDQQGNAAGGGNRRSLVQQQQPQAMGGMAGPAGGAVRLLVAVASACCTDVARRRRDAIRDTWARTIQDWVSCQLSTEKPHVRWCVPLYGTPRLLLRLHPLLQGKEERQPETTVVLRFFLAQPPDADAAALWLPALQVGLRWGEVLFDSSTKPCPLMRSCMALAPSLGRPVAG